MAGNSTSDLDNLFFPKELLDALEVPVSFSDVLFTNPAAKTPAPTATYGGIPESTESILTKLSSSVWLADLAALRSVPSARFSNNDTINIRNHSSTLDIGGGSFIWDAAHLGKNDPAISAAPTINVFDDDGVFIKPNDVLDASPGRWVRAESLYLGEGKVKVAWWGAVPYFRTFYGAATPWIEDTFDSLPAFEAAVKSLPLAHPTYVTDTGRRFHSGVLLIDVGQYWLSDTWYVPPTSRVTGSGVGKTTLIRMPNTAAFGDGESFVVKSEDLTIEISNNNFDNILEELSVCGNSFTGLPGSYDNGNEGVSGVLWAGAQGSYVRNVRIYDCAMRGLVQDGSGCNMFDIWVSNVTQGPGLYFKSFGAGWKHRNLSIEHVNQLGLYDLAGHAGVKSPAVFLDGCVEWQCNTLQCEASKLELYMYQCIRCEIPYFVASGDITISQQGVLLKGNGYHNKFGVMDIASEYDVKFEDQTDIAVANGVNGEYDPALFDGTWLYSPEIDVADSAAVLAFNPGSVHPGQVMQLTEEGNRKVRFLGPVGTNTATANWENLIGPNEQLTLPVATAKTITAISAAAAAVVTCTAHGIPNGATVNISGSNSTPPIDGLYPVTVLTANTFSIPVTTTVSGSAGSINTGVLRVVGGILPLKPQTWLVQTVANGNQGAENFMASNFWNSNAGGSFVLTSLGKSAYFGDITSTPHVSGGMTPTWPYVDIYLISNNASTSLGIILTLLGKAN
jgi:hypothetical protein